MNNRSVRVGLYLCACTRMYVWEYLLCLFCDRVVGLWMWMVRHVFILMMGLRHALQGLGCVTDVRLQRRAACRCLPTRGLFPLLLPLLSSTTCSYLFNLNNEWVVDAKFRSVA